MREYQADKQGLIDLVSAVKCDRPLTVLEVGSFAGESAQVFLSTGAVEKIICVDIWEIVDRGPGNTYPDIKSAERRFDAAFSRNGSVIKFKGDLDKFVKSNVFKQFDGKIDIVYIDADHTYEGCCKDIELAMQIVKPIIAFSGHDFADSPPHIRGVKKAVLEKLGKPDMVFCDTSWLKFVDYESRSLR